MSLRTPAAPLTSADPPSIGRYEIVGLLGQGGMARVYLARTAAGRWFAVKVVWPWIGADPQARSRFEREIRAARRVACSYTAAIDEACPGGDPPWYAAEYVPAPSLARLVDEAGPLPVPTIRWLAAGVCEALIAIHRAGVIHRDLKPSNLLVERGGPRLIDFGIARSSDETALTVPGMLLGTTAYMSPEQLAGTPRPASDMFALGGTIIFAATGHSPHPDVTPEQAVARLEAGIVDSAEVPGGIIELVRRCMRRDPADRPTPGAVLAELAADRANPLPLDGRLPPRALDVIDRYARHGEALRESATTPLHLIRPRVTVPPRRPARPAAATTVDRARWTAPIPGVVAVAGTPYMPVVRTATEICGLSGCDGTVRWRTTLGPAPGIAATLLAADDVLCCTSGSGHGVTVSAIRTGTGDVLWTRSGGPHLRPARTPAAPDSLFLLDGDQVHCVDVTDGRVRWEQQIHGGEATHLDACSVHVYASGSDRIWRMERPTGNRRRSLRIRDAIAVTVDDDAVFGRSPSSYFAYDGTKGGFSWRRTAPMTSRPVAAEVIPCARSVGFRTTDASGSNGETHGTFVVLDRATGTERWRTDIAGDDIHVSSDTVLLRRKTGLCLLDAATGATRWRHADRTGLGAAAVLADMVIEWDRNGLRAIRTTPGS